MSTILYIVISLCIKERMAMIHCVLHNDNYSLECKNMVIWVVMVDVEEDSEILEKCNSFLFPTSALAK